MVNHEPSPVETRVPPRFLLSSTVNGTVAGPTTDTDYTTNSYIKLSHSDYLSSSGKAEDGPDHPLQPVEASPRKIIAWIHDGCRRVLKVTPG